MKSISNKTYDLLFKIGVVIKALISIGEIVVGLVLLFFTYEALYQIALSLFGAGLLASPPGTITGYIVDTFRSLSATPRSVWVFIFLSHGIVKILLVEGLWTKKMWAYPIAAGIFALFVIYQFYQLAYTPSILLWLITIFDIILIGLILHEYRQGKKHIEHLGKMI